MFYRVNRVQVKIFTMLAAIAFIFLGFGWIPVPSDVDASAKSGSVSQPSVAADVLSGDSAASADETIGEDDEIPELDIVFRKGMISAGLYHTVLLNESGDVYAWGDNSFGQLGIGTTDNKELPAKVEGLTDVIMVSAGAYHTLALSASGDVYAWGRNTFGQIGDGTTTISLSPVRIEDIPPMMEISAGSFHSIGLAINGGVYTWGDNTLGQSGPVESEIIYDSAQNVLGSRVLKPQLMAGPGIRSISAGGSHSLYLDDAGIVYAWGDNGSGQLGDGTVISRGTPMPVSGLSSVTDISAGFSYNMAVSDISTGEGAAAVRYQNLFTWGSDSSGQLGIGEKADQNRIVMAPVRVDANGDADEGNDRISLIDAGYYSSMMTVPVFIDGRRRDSLYVWGNNSYGQLGIGDMPSQNKPLKLIGVSNGWEGDSFLPFESISSGGYHTALLSVKGFAGVCGRADKGQLGNVSSIRTDAFTGVSLRDAISPEWAEGSILDIKLAQTSLQIKWQNASDNIAVRGYRLSYTNKDNESVTIRLDLVNQYTILDFDKDSDQVLTLHAIDQSGNKSEFPLEHIFGEGGTPEDISAGEAAEISGEDLSAPDDEIPDEAGTESSDAGSDDVSGEGTVSAPDVTPEVSGSADIDYLRWSPDLYVGIHPPEVPWNVDYIYGPGVVLPPEDNSINVAVGITVTVIVLFLLISLVSFRRTHKGHGLIEEIFRPHKKPHDKDRAEPGEPVDIGDGVEILPEDSEEDE
ncbi:MAG: RCC1 domain-containing protein [Saccharofermentanales bacterium]